MNDELDQPELARDPDQTVKSVPVPDAPDWGSEETVKSAAVTGDADANTIPRPAASPKIPPPPPATARPPQKRPQARRRRRREWVWVLAAGSLFGMVGLFSLALLFVLGGDTSTADDVPTMSSVVDGARPTAVDLRSTNPDSIASGQRITLDNGEDIVLEPWDGTGRLTVLMMGIDRRPGETGWAFRTDTIILISIDPEDDKIGILSIPRDLYVPIRGYAEPQRINTPLVLGEYREKGYGPTLAMETVQWNLGIRVNEYLIVDFNAFIALVDAIDGIEVTIDYVINDREYPSANYGYDPFYLAPGTHQLGGYDALRFARTRHGGSDIERAGRQQQVLFAIRNKILDRNLLPRLILQAPSLFGNVKDNVNTSLELDEMIELAWYLKDIPTENITPGVIDYTMAQGYRIESGGVAQDVLIPIRSRIGALMVEVFGEDYGE